jgi:hypothetical protein
VSAWVEVLPFDIEHPRIGDGVSAVQLVGAASVRVACILRLDVRFQSAAKPLFLDPHC